MPLADFNLRGDFRFNAAACMLDDGRAADVSRASLNHERAVLNRYLNKTYAAARSDCVGSDAQFRLEEDQTQLGIYWNTTGMYLACVPIVA